MAKKKMKRAARRAVAVARVAGSKAARVARRGARGARAGLSAHKGELVAMAAGAGSAYLASKMETDGKTLPTVAGVQPNLVYGVAGAVLGTMVPATSRGMVGEVVRGVGAAQLAVAAHKLGAGQPLRVSGEDEVGYTDETE